jgi:hypothetical protein
VKRSCAADLQVLASAAYCGCSRSARKVQQDHFCDVNSTHCQLCRAKTTLAVSRFEFGTRSVPRPTDLCLAVFSLASLNPMAGKDEIRGLADFNPCIVSRASRVSTTNHCDNVVEPQRGWYSCRTSSRRSCSAFPFPSCILTFHFTTGIFGLASIVLFN